MRRLICGNLAETAHALRRYVIEAENDRQMSSDALETLQEGAKATQEVCGQLAHLKADVEVSREHLANLQGDYDAYKVSMAGAIGGIESDAAALRTHLSDLQADSDLQKGRWGDTVAAIQKDAETLREHLARMQGDSDAQKIHLSDTVAAIQKDAETLSKHLAGMQGDYDDSKETMTRQLEALEEFKSGSVLMAESLEKDGRAVLDHVGRIQTDHDRIAAMAAKTYADADELREITKRLSQLSSDLHRDLTLVAEAVSQLHERGADLP